MVRRTLLVHVKHLAVAAIAALAIAFGVTPTSRQVLAAPSASEDDLSRALDRIREVTKKFKDVEKAHEAGYPTRVPRCIDSQDGGMGHHYMHPGLLDDTLELEKPEILVYAPVEDGKPKLAGVEYIVPLSAWRGTDPPKILGQSLKRSDQLGIWYLHVWVWEENVNGMFADWNPAVKCPAATM